MAVTAKNTLMTVGQYSPMQATPGYQPGLLPDIDQGDAHCDDEIFDGISRRAHCLRDIALQGMIE
eukprot:10598807-Prorocentrum_lima.AAC.1